MKRKLRILLAISQTMIRVGLKAQISSIEPGIELLEAMNVPQAQQMSATCDIGIMHQTLLPQQIETLGIPFIVITEQPTHKELVLLRESPLCFGYASQHLALEPLLSYFQTTHLRPGHSFWLDPYIAPLLIHKNDIDVFRLDGWDKLTTRERAVFDLLQQSMTTPEIAETLGIATCTVRTYKQHICQKLEIEVKQLKKLAFSTSRKE